MLIDLGYVRDNLVMVALLVFIIVLVNTVLNAVILRVLGSSWRRAGYAGALLSQVGEFSFILAAMAHTNRMLPDDEYRLIVAVIAISLMLSPAWIGACKAMLKHPEGRPDRPRVG
jgi:CPA2 family monovalent cation:H+ antiporter-2